VRERLRDLTPEQRAQLRSMREKAGGAEPPATGE